MANDTYLTVVGNLTADPELRFTQAGIAVASFTVASTPRKFDRQANQWVDGEALFQRCSIWRDAAENVTETLTKGARVVVYGRLEQHSFQDREGNNRTATELQVEEVGPSLKYATAQVRKVDRRQQQQGGYSGQRQPQGGYGGPPQGQGGYGGPQGGYAPQGAGNAPQGGGFSGGYDDPPF